MMRRQANLLSPRSTQSGFTIVESLVAIMIVSILMVAIAPVVALSVATRVQARRVELGTQAARTYIDGVRSGKITPPKARRVLKEVKPDATNPGNKIFDPKRDLFAQFPAPTTLLPACDTSLASYPYCLDNIGLSLYCVDLDGDGACIRSSSKDLIVQAFRSTTDPSLTTDNGSKGYVLGVRVYRIDGFDGGTLKTTEAENGKKVATYAGGTSNRYAPLVEISTDVRGNATNYQGFCDRLGGCPK